MNGQMSFVGVPTPPDLKLTRRQRFALELIARRPQSSVELGGALHEYRMREGGRGHLATAPPCQFCKAEGSHMGSRLRELGLVRFARHLSVWYLADQGRPQQIPGDGYDPRTAEIPF